MLQGKCIFILIYIYIYICMYICIDYLNISLILENVDVGGVLTVRFRIYVYLYDLVSIQHPLGGVLTEEVF